MRWVEVFQRPLDFRDHGLAEGLQVPLCLQGVVRADGGGKYHDGRTIALTFQYGPCFPGLDGIGAGHPVPVHPVAGPYDPALAFGTDQGFRERKRGRLGRNG